jgi:hypothetical protein
MRDPLLYDSKGEAMALCKLNPKDEAYWGRGMLCPYHEGMWEGMETVIEWLLDPEGDS